MEPEPTLVTVVQHAEKERTSGDPGLTPIGWQQALRVADTLAAEAVDLVLCSPMRRARETAQPLVGRTRVAAAYDDRLRERMNWDGTTTLEQFLADWDTGTRDRTFVPRLGDSSEIAGDRFAAVVREATAEPDRHVVLVSHGGVTVDGLRTLVGDAEVGRWLPGWRDGMPAAGLTRLRVTGERVELLAVGDIAHLG